MSEFIREMRHILPRDQWVAMMQENKAMRDAGSTPAEILAALQAKYAP
jgi:hypothetical protein